MEKKFSLNDLVEKWSSPYVAREQVDKFSGGALSPKTLANLDSAGLGPKGRLRVSRKIVYPVRELVAWMESRTVSLD